MAVNIWLKVLNWLSLIFPVSGVALVGIATILPIASFWRGQDPINWLTVSVFFTGLVVGFIGGAALGCRSQILGRRLELWPIRKSLWRG